MILLAIAQSETAQHTFRYVSESSLTSVHVAGTFNGWSNSKNPMKVEADGRTWTVTLPLSLGQHQYKFVLNSSTWVTDPKAKSQDDGGGNINSLLFVEPADFKLPANIGDGRFTLSALQHSTSIPYFNVDQGKAQVSVRVRKGDVEFASVTIGRVNIAMNRVAGDDLYEFFKVSIPVSAERFEYTIVLLDGAGSKKLGPYTVDPKSVPVFETPNWVSRGIVYQIFPDRFANGSTANDPEGVMPWDGTPTYGNRFGGDITGVKSKLSYLKSLGVSTVYFNPIFKSPSNHRYEADTYFEIDPQFGTNAEFVDLGKAMKAQGLGYVLDLCLNHTSPRFFAFDDIVKNGEKSEYLDWYFIKNFPVVVKDRPDYEAWFGFPSMPKLNTKNVSARKHLLSVAPFWYKTAPGLKGVRLDVANEVEMDFWRAFRKEVKGLNKDLWIVGEHWGDGRPWLSGDQWDSMMGYQFRDANLRFIAEQRTTPSQYLDTLFRVYDSYVPQVSRNLMLLLSSHDTPRFLTLCGGDVKKQKLAATVQFTWPGTPSVYYGEEIGMQGGVDPQNRRGMEWSKATSENDLLNYYKQLGRIRQSSESLKVGSPIRLHADDQAGVLAFARKAENDASIIAVNRSTDRRSFTVSTKLLTQRSWQDALSGKQFSSLGDSRTLALTLEPMSAAILQPIPSQTSIPARKVKTKKATSLSTDSLERTGVSN